MTHWWPYLQGFTVPEILVQSNLDYLELSYLDFSIIRTCFPGPFFFINVNKMWYWKIELIKSSITLPNICLKQWFNRVRFEKAWAARDGQLSDAFSCILRECHSWFCISYVNTWTIDRKLKSRPCLCNESGPFCW